MSAWHTVPIDTAARLLQILALLESRPWWSGEDLANRLEVTTRTVRRDLARLRDLGYPIEATTGRHGGYRLGAGGRLPPLVLDDDEAVAVAIALRLAAEGTGSGLEDPALSALAKLDQVLPPRLRERVAAVRAVTIGLRSRDIPATDSDALVTIAMACRRPERLRFDYVDGAGRSSDRFVEPYRLVYTDRRWYLVANDKDRHAWRSFRVDRMSAIEPTGVPFTHADPPDAAAFVAEGLAVSVYPVHASVLLQCSQSAARRIVAPTIGVIEPVDDATSLARIGGDLDWIARYLAGLEVPFEVVEPDDLNRELRALGRRLLRHRRAPLVGPA